MIVLDPSESIFFNFQNKAKGIASKQNTQIFQYKFMLNQCKIVYQYNKQQICMEGQEQMSLNSKSQSRSQIISQYNETCELENFFNECRKQYKEKNMDAFVGKVYIELQIWYKENNKICKSCYKEFDDYFSSRTKGLKQKVQNISGFQQLTFDSRNLKYYFSNCQLKK